MATDIIEAAAIAYVRALSVAERRAREPESAPAVVLAPAP